MNPFLLLPGIAIAAFVFGATLWSLTQLVRQKGLLKWAHGAAFGMVLLTMAMLQIFWQPGAFASGVALVLAGLAAAVLETGWSRLLPMSQAAFGFAVASGLPFA